jgi:hypothetical protein
MGLARKRSLTVSADGTTNQTGWCSCKYGGMVVIEVPGTMSATVTLQRRNADGTTSDATDNNGNVITFTKAGTYTISPNSLQAEYRLNTKSGAFVSGPYTQMIEGR